MDRQTDGTEASSKAVLPSAVCSLPYLHNARVQPKSSLSAPLRVLPSFFTRITQLRLSQHLSVLFFEKSNRSRRNGENGESSPWHIAAHGCPRRERSAKHAADIVGIFLGPAQLGDIVLSVVVKEPDDRQARWVAQDRPQAPVDLRGSTTRLDSSREPKLWVPPRRARASGVVSFIAQIARFYSLRNILHRLPWQCVPQLPNLASSPP
jgi:hypothetical protein